jgi:hypothetical protein
MNVSFLRIFDFVLCIVFDEEEHNASETAFFFFLTWQGRETPVNYLRLFSNCRQPTSIYFCTDT